MNRRLSLRVLVAAIGAICAVAAPAFAQDQIGLGTSWYSSAFHGTGGTTINIVLTTSNNGWTWGYGGASGSGSLGSSGTYSISNSAQTAATLQSQGGGRYSVAQGGAFNFVYTSSGSWGYPSGTILLQGTLTLTSVAMQQGSSATAIAAANLAVSGGALAGNFPGGAGQTSLVLATAGNLDSLLGSSASMTAQINSPDTITPGGASAPLQIVTNVLSDGAVQQPYNASLRASGGNPPYQWSMTSGRLPNGLGLDGPSGNLSGTPTETGGFSFGITVRDAVQATASRTFSLFVNAVTLDAYGGAQQLPCTRGASSFFYAQKNGNRWWLCTPTGNVFWMSGVYAVDADNRLDPYGRRYTDFAGLKYGDTSTSWGPQQNRRLKSWGFNTVAEYASVYAQPTTTNPNWPSGHPFPMPFTVLIPASAYTLRNVYNYAPGPVKELVRPTNPSVYTGYRAHSPDIWDPNYTAWIAGYLQHDQIGSAWINGPNKSYLAGINVDETDTLQGFGAGTDFLTVVNGQLVNDKQQPHLAWLIWITPPTQAGSAEYGLTYSDRTVYTKLAFSNFFQQRYVTITALNLAWGSSYTTFGSIGGWGTGTGLLDEDGTHSWVPKDYNALGDANPIVKRDLDDFLLYHAQKYFSQTKSVLNTYAPGRLYLGPTVLSTWGSPPRRQILQAAASYIDVYMAGGIPAGVADDQQRVDFIAQYLGDKPWLEWEGLVAQPDSYMYQFPDVPTDNVSSVPYSTQAQRGQAYSDMVSRLVNTRTSAGAYPITGFKWWQFADNAGELLNWGLVTRRDNEYNGTAASRATGADSWGFPTGGEDRDYGDFLSAVRAANRSFWTTLLSRSW